MTLDRALIVEPGSKSVDLIFHEITNFNPELSSDVIKIRTTYDGLIIDESGNAETNRKAETGFESIQILNIEEFTFTPTTEGVPANYTVVIDPGFAFNETTMLRFEFPKEFARGLGDNIRCLS